MSLDKRLIVKTEFNIGGITMKKYLVLFLVLLMGVSAFGACSKDEESPERNITVTAEDTVGATESVALEDDAVGTMYQVFLVF